MIPTVRRLYYDVTGTHRVWLLAFTGALFLTSLFFVQDILIGGALGRELPFSVLLAQHALPWVMWAALAPVLLQLLRAVQITRDRFIGPVLFHVATGGLVAAAKLLVSVPLSTLLIWHPLQVPVGDGVRFLMENRLGANILMYWLFVAAYTAVSQLLSHQVRAIGEDEPISAPQRKDIVPTRLPVTEGQRTFFVRPTDIEYVEAADNYLTMYAGERSYKVRDTLSNIAERLPDAFVRVHRSYVVNTDRIREVQPWFRGEHVILMDNGAKIITGRTYRDSIRKLIHYR